MNVNRDAHSRQADQTTVPRELLFGLAFVGATVVFTVLARVPPGVSALAAIWCLAFGIPGVWLTRTMLRASSTSLQLLVVGAVAGQAAGRLVLVGVDTLLASRGAVILAMTAALVLATAIAPGLWKTIRLDAEDRRDIRWIFGFSTAIVLIAAVVYSFVGRLTESGYAFVPYFSQDFIQHAAVTSELSKSGPAENVYFVGQPLHYYWMYHSWPAALAVLTGTPARYAVSSTIPLIALQFVAVLVLLPRGWSRAGARYAGVAIALFAPSFIGVLAVARAIAPRLIELVPVVSTTASYSFLSHSWLRDALYEPHALTALTLTVASYLLARLLGPTTGLATAGLCGFLAGSALLTDGFIGALAVAWGTAWLPWTLARQRQSPWTAWPFIVLVGFWVLLGLTLGLLPLGARAAVPGLHPAARYAPFYLLSEVGIFGLLGITGLVLAVRRRPSHPPDLWPWAALLILSLVFTFGLIVPTDPNTALRKGVKVFQLSLLAFSPLCIEWLARPRRNRLVSTLAVVLTGVATMTTFTDTWQHTIGGLRKPGTLFVTRDQMQAMDWIRRCTPAAAVFQDVSQVRPERKRGDNSDMFIPALAERRVLWSNYHHPYILQIPEQDVRERKSALLRVFGSNTAMALGRELSNLHVDYLYVDHREPAPDRALRELTARGDLGAPLCFGQSCVIAVSPAARAGGATCQDGR